MKYGAAIRATSRFAPGHATLPPTAPVTPFQKTINDEVKAGDEEQERDLEDERAREAIQQRV